ncbi:MAG: carboxypeptidase-like regulatory domain-containing protein, partial [Caldilineaceae bacterium]
MLHKQRSSRGLLCMLLILPVAVATLVLLVGARIPAALGAAPQEPSPPTTLTPGPVATLPPGGAISGRVTNQQGEPLAGIEVSVYDRVPVTGSRWYAPPVTTTANGLYSIPWVYPAPNVVRFNDPEGTFATEAYNSSGAGQAGDWLPVAVGETLTGIDARLSRKGRVSGRVLGEDGNPTRDVMATLCDSDYSDFGNCYSAVPQADGRYVITGVTPGSYFLSFGEMDAFEIVYDAEFYDNVPELKRERALPIAVGDGEHVAHLNAMLAFRQGPNSPNAMAAISGTVTNPYGGKASWYAADLLQLVGDRWVLASSTFGSMNGAWSMREVPVGSYRLQFRDGVGPFANSWYGGGNDPMQAQEIVLTPGAQVGGIQGVLGTEVGGRLEGTTRYNTQTAPYRQVTILRRTPQGAWAFYGDTLTSGQSQWALGGVLPGVYRVAFNKSGYSNAGEWY